MKSLCLLFLSCFLMIACGQSGFEGHQSSLSDLVESEFSLSSKAGPRYLCPEGSDDGNDDGWGYVQNTSCIILGSDTHNRYISAGMELLSLGGRAPASDKVMYMESNFKACNGISTSRNGYGYENGETCINGCQKRVIDYQSRNLGFKLVNKTIGYKYTAFTGSCSGINGRYREYTCVNMIENGESTVKWEITASFQKEESQCQQ